MKATTMKEYQKLYLVDAVIAAEAYFSIEEVMSKSAISSEAKNLKKTISAIAGGVC